MTTTSVLPTQGCAGGKSEPSSTSSSVVAAKTPNQPPWHTGGRVYVMWTEKAKDAPNIVIGTFSIIIQLVDVLFDSGAMHSSFISSWLRR